MPSVCVAIHITRIVNVVHHASPRPLLLPLRRNNHPRQGESLVALVAPLRRLHRSMRRLPHSRSPRRRLVLRVYSANRVPRCVACLALQWNHRRVHLCTGRAHRYSHALSHQYVYQCKSFDHRFAHSHISMHCRVNITTDHIACACIIRVTTEVVDAAANREFVETTTEGERPATGSRKVDTWSMCFQGGTFDRVKERCVSLPATPVCVSHIIAYSIADSCHSSSINTAHCYAFSCTWHTQSCVACAPTGVLVTSRRQRRRSTP